MQLSTILFHRSYALLWQIALPILHRRPRLLEGWAQRCLQFDALKDNVENPHHSSPGAANVASIPTGPFDLWIQAASGGEALLTNTLLAELKSQLRPNSRLRVLATSGTRQGMETLASAQQQHETDRQTEKAEEKQNKGHLDLAICYFPFDKPSIMQHAFDRYQPRLVVLLETELWPGLLYEAKQRQVQVFLINGRISDKSVNSYRKLRRLFQAFGPERVWAISPLNQNRFAEILGPSKVGLMNNIKFDRLYAETPRISQPARADEPESFPLAKLGTDKPLIVFGSIREEEESQILNVVQELRALRPDCTIAIFPKHVERAEKWLDRLSEAGLEARTRSTLNRATNSPPINLQATETGSPPTAEIIVWDTFGELGAVYAMAAATFVGGSLQKLGGHNFLEPLAVGVRPIIGPHWKDFRWIGREIIDTGLVTQIDSDKQLVTALLNMVDDSFAGKYPRSEIQQQVADYFSPRRGGTRFICSELLAALTHRAI